MISDKIVKYLGDKSYFLPTMLPTNGKHFKAVDGHGIQSLGRVQISPKLSTVAGPCRLRNIKAHIMPCDETTAVYGVSCPGEIILGNPFLVHSGLNVTDFIAENIDHLSPLDYGNLHGEAVPDKIGKLGVKLLTTDPLSNEGTSFAPAYSAEAPRLCHLIANGDSPLRKVTTSTTRMSKSVTKMKRSWIKPFRKQSLALRSIFRTVLRILSEP